MILNLILYNDKPGYTEMRNILRDYLNKMKVKYFFYCYNNNIESDYKIDNDMLYIKGEETFVPGILQKTIKAIEICLHFKFTYIVRTNISTVINFKLLNEHLAKNDINYGGASIYGIPLNYRVPKDGIVDDRYSFINFIAGFAIILSRKMAKLVVEKQKDIDYNVIDDVSFAVFFKKHNIFPNNYNNTILTSVLPNKSCSDYIHFKHNTCDVDDKALFYRNKRSWSDRTEDVKCIKIITDALIKQNNQYTV